MSPDELACQALLNCLIREVSGPENQAWERGGHLIIRLARSGVLLRAGLRRPSKGIGPRPDGRIQVRDGQVRDGQVRDGQVREESGWSMLGWRRLADLIADELTLATGVPNEEFIAQVADGHAALTAIQQARRPDLAGNQSGDGWAGRYLASEQALVAGHRFHPAPKARPGAARDWLRYAPEAGARFPLRFLGVRAEIAAEGGDTTELDRLGGPVPPDGYRLLPAHPWQLRLLERQSWLRQAIRHGLIVDLGDGPRDVVPTSSVRTVYDPAADLFCKFSLNVRMTNCLRKSAWYELAGATVLTRLLTPVFADLADSYPGTVLLGEPGYRTVALATRDAYEGLAVIARNGLARRIAPDVTPLLAAALAEPPGSLTGGLFDGRDSDWLLDWWTAYVGVVAPPVLDAFFRHGVVLEPHLQNVLAGVDRDGWPVQAIFRDLEGVKLVTPDHDALLAGLAPGVARGLAYDRRRGWDRVAYCLLVNHLAELAAAIADRYRPDEAAKLEAALWSRTRRVLTAVARDHGWPSQLRAVLAGVPLPAKANLRVRWARAADREAGYVPVPSPLRPSGPRVPEPGVPEPRVPEPRVPEPGVPEPGVPERVPEPGVPELGMLGPRQPELAPA